MRLLAAGALLLTVCSGVATSATTCDRACLEGFVTQYLDAMIARNPYSLPLAQHLKFTENEQAIPFGEGLWATATALGTYKLYVSDVGSGEAGFLGTVRENGNPVAFALRLRISQRQIAEADTIVVRDPGAAQAIEALGQPDPLYSTALAKPERRPRNEMISVVNKYAEGILQSKGSLVPFDSQCNRIQNGVQTTNNPKLLLDPKDTWTPISLGCDPQLDTKFFSFVRGVRPRNFLVDEDRGLVLGWLLFDIPGTVPSVDIPGHGSFAIPLPYQAPTTLDIAELYKIKNGKILKIEALQTNVPYKTGPPSRGSAAHETDAG
ncbi:MAG TPA: hypothetical protein VFW44_14125, partial [Bryobacteraceae bacterium]|nr:hypothetical protein [Bryobacteraceae bacterium]